MAHHGVVADDGAGLVDGDPGQELAGAALFQDPIRVVDDVLVAIAVEVPGGTGEGQSLLGGLEAAVTDLALGPDLALVRMQDVMARRQGRWQPLDQLEFLPLLLDVAPLDAVHGPGDQEGAQALGGLLQGPRHLVMGQTGEVEGPAGGPRHQADRRVLEFDPETNRGVRPLRNGVLEEVDQALFQGQFDLPADRVGHPQAAAQVGEQRLDSAETGVMARQFDVDAVVLGHGTDAAIKRSAPPGDPQGARGLTRDQRLSPKSWRNLATSSCCQLETGVKRPKKKRRISGSSVNTRPPMRRRLS